MSTHYEEHIRDVAGRRYEALQRVRDLHRYEEGRFRTVCRECGKSWPCPTIRAMDGAS